MTTKEVASRYNELEKQGRWDLIQDELFSADIVSIEPAHAAEMGMATTTKGIEAVKAKGAAFNEGIAEMHGGYCNEAAVAGNFFTLTMGMDCTMKNGHRMNMDEVCVFEVKDGKIVTEQFFF